MYTELETINFMLSHVGAAPVNDLLTPLPDILSAQLRLKEANIWIQKKGWWFNRLYQQTFTPDEITNEINLPPNTLKVISPYPTFVIEKNDKLYSPFHDSFEFQNSINLDLILLMEWEDMPGSAQDAIMYRAAENMIIHELEDMNKAQVIKQDGQIAYIALQAEDLQIKQRSVYSTPAFQKMMSRVRPYKRSGSSYNPTYPGGGLI